MSKLESLGKFLILTEGCSPEKVSEVISTLSKLDAKWGGCVPLLKHTIPLESVSNQKTSINIIIKSTGFRVRHSREGFYRENPEYCGGNFLSAEYFLFLAEDHLYEQT